MPALPVVAFDHLNQEIVAGTRMTEGTRVYGVTKASNPFLATIASTRLRSSPYVASE